MSDFCGSFSQHADETLALCTRSGKEKKKKKKECVFTSYPAWSAQMINPLVYSSVANENATKIPTS